MDKRKRSINKIEKAGSSKESRSIPDFLDDC